MENIRVTTGRLQVGEKAIFLDDLLTGNRYIDSSANGKGLDAIRVGDTYYAKDKSIAEKLRKSLVLQNKGPVSIKINPTPIQKGELFFDHAVSEAASEFGRWLAANGAERSVRAREEGGYKLKSGVIIVPGLAPRDEERQVQRILVLAKPCEYYTNLENGVKVFILSKEGSDKAGIIELKTEKGNSYIFDSVEVDPFNRNSRFWRETSNSK